ncbi:MAG TPA: hypothetical protein PLW40_12330 [Syntrophales bacterium]|nr:hypothetical protein [Syntrophales bacterium]
MKMEDVANKKKTVVIRLREQDWKQVKENADKYGLRVSQYIKYCVFDRIR